SIPASPKGSRAEQSGLAGGYGAILRDERAGGGASEIRQRGSEEGVLEVGVVDRRPTGRVPDREVAGELDQTRLTASQFDLIGILVRRVGRNRTGRHHGEPDQGDRFRSESVGQRESEADSVQTSPNGELDPAARRNLVRTFLHPRSEP